MSHDQWDVVVVPFPYTDRLSEKRRPALVISNRAFNDRHGLCWLLMITSAENAPWDGDIAIADLAAAGLPHASIIRTAKIATVGTEAVLRKVGGLAAHTQELVVKSLRDVFLFG